MRKFAYFVLSTTFVFGAPLAMLAQDSNTGTSEDSTRRTAPVRRVAPVPPRQELQRDIRNFRNTAQGEMKMMRGDTRVELEQKRAMMRAATTTEARMMLKDEVKEDVQKFRGEMKARRVELRTEIEKKRTQFQEEAAKRREAMKKKFGEVRAERIEQFFKQMIERFQAATKRLHELSDRIDARLDKDETAGKDVTDTREKLARAQTQITEAEKALEDAKTKYSGLSVARDPKAAFKQVHDIVNDVRDQIKEAHRALVGVIAAIKGEQPPEEPGSATTTPLTPATTTPSVESNTGTTTP